jgi:hypothetical protein
MTHKPFFYQKAKSSIEASIAGQGEQISTHLYVISEILEGNTPIVAGTKTLNRYSILPGKTFAAGPKSKTKYKVLRLVADDVVVQDLNTQRVETVQVNKLLKRWSDEGIQEISLLDDIIATVKSILGPVLGAFLTAALISWISEKLVR